MRREDNLSTLRKGRRGIPVAALGSYEGLWILGEEALGLYALEGFVTAGGV